jgi:hypothetical protein
VRQAVSTHIAAASLPGMVSVIDEELAENPPERVAHRRTDQGDEFAIDDPSCDRQRLGADRRFDVTRATEAPPLVEAVHG